MAELVAVSIPATFPLLAHLAEISERRNALQVVPKELVTVAEVAALNVDSLVVAVVVAPAVFHFHEALS